MTENPELMTISSKHAILLQKQALKSVTTGPDYGDFVHRRSGFQAFSARNRNGLAGVPAIRERFWKKVTFQPNFSCTITLETT